MGKEPAYLPTAEAGRPESCQRNLEFLTGLENINCSQSNLSLLQKCFSQLLWTCFPFFHPTGLYAVTETPITSQPHTFYTLCPIWGMLAFCSLTPPIKTLPILQGLATTHLRRAFFIHLFRCIPLSRTDAGNLRELYLSLTFYPYYICFIVIGE